MLSHRHAMLTACMSDLFDTAPTMPIIGTLRISLGHRGGTMDRRLALKSLAAIALCPICSRASRAAEAAHWSYEGATGADRWSALDAANRVCSAGTRQSPIDIADAVVAELPPLEIGWSKAPDTIVNNGHTVQVNFTGGGTLTAGKGRYELRCSFTSTGRASTSSAPKVFRWRSTSCIGAPRAGSRSSAC